MKPRLEALPYTDEDDKIWRRVQKGWYGDLWNRSHFGDRRDADLMLMAQEAPYARFIAGSSYEKHWAVSMTAFQSDVYQWRLVRRKDSKSMDIKQRLKQRISMKLSEDPDGRLHNNTYIVELARDALAEIERLEQTTLERAWKEFVRRSDGAIRSDGSVYPIFTNTREAFTAGFASASRRSLGEDS